MSSNAKTNRANSKNSTGPKTEAGKQRSSRNALRHGLTAQTVVMPSEDLELYESHKKSFHDDHSPKGSLESNLVQALADATWRLNRVAALEANLLAVSANDVQDSMALIAFLERQAKAIAALSLHSQRLSRQIEKTAAQLSDLQKSRRSDENQQLDALLDITEMYESRGETYDPSEDGFVFSEAQIDDAILARNRDRLLEEAYEASETSPDEEEPDGACAIPPQVIS
jgi:hypothetical protein